jgi:hypothetical protein
MTSPGLLSDKRKMIDVAGLRIQQPQSSASCQFASHIAREARPLCTNLKTSPPWPKA